uniref:Uncharacterized protein n=1 Tax=Pararge aegeria TaxID=116150 RepID=S4PRX8_9NEOP
MLILVRIRNAELESQIYFFNTKKLRCANRSLSYLTQTLTDNAQLNRFRSTKLLFYTEDARYRFFCKIRCESLRYVNNPI